MSLSLARAWLTAGCERLSRNAARETWRPSISCHEDRQQAQITWLNIIRIIHNGYTHFRFPFNLVMIQNRDKGRIEYGPVIRN